MQKVFYDKDTQKEVIDPKGTKTLEEVKSSYGLGNNTVELTKDENEGHKFDGTKLVKVDLVAEAAARQLDRKNTSDAAAVRVKAKLGLSDSDFDDLKTALS